MIGTNTAASPAEQDWRFAALVARTWAEPALIDRYTEDPHMVLAEYGLVVDEQHEVPSLGRMSEIELVIEDLDWSAKARTGTCAICSSPPGELLAPVHATTAGSPRRR